MKKIKKIMQVFFTFIIILTTVVISGDVKITTESKKVYSNSGEVSDRELALLASLVYEDVPKRCIKDNKLIKSSGCHFIVNDTINDIEGMSINKINKFAKLAQANVEAGQKYYLYNFADVSEAGKWEIVNFENIASKYAKEGNIGWQGTFSAITFRKDDNYVISFRGTDFPDVLEWLQDISYVKGDMDQSDSAFKYAQKEYVRIVNAEPTAKIYVTGHSLGAYLAQIGGAGIISRGSLNGLNYNDNLSVDLKNQYNYNESKNLVKVVYFNGMGVSALGTITNDNTLIYKNAINALARVNADGTIAKGATKVNYNDSISSSGRLISYSMEGDPVSSIGFHYGEIRKLQPAADAITNHKGNHFWLKSTKDFKNLLEGTKNKLATLFDGNDVAKYNSIINNDILNNKYNSDKIFRGLSKTKAKTYNTTFNNNINKFSKNLTVASNEVIDKISPSVQIKNDTENVARYSYAGFDVKNALEGIIGTGTEYKIASIPEIANITHETDSFLCLIDGDNGVPKVTGGAINVSYDKGENGNTAKVYTNDTKTFSLVANVTGGCARKYTWTKVDKDGNKIQDISSGINGINNYIMIPKNRKVSNGTREYYKVEITYNDEYREQKLRTDNGAYKYVYGGTHNSGNKTVTQMYEVIYDKEAPTCSFDPSSITIKKGTTRNVSFSCTDNENSISIATQKNRLIDKFYFTHSVKECGSNTCIVAISAKKRLFNVNRTITYKTYVKDRANNKATVTSKLKIKTTRK